MVDDGKCKTENKTVFFLEIELKETREKVLFLKYNARISKSSLDHQFVRCGYHGQLRLPDA